MSMFPMRVLLDVDSSEEAERAAKAGIELSSKTDSELHVIHVASYPSTVYFPEGEEGMRGALTEREGYRLVHAAPFPGILQVPKQKLFTWTNLAVNPATHRGS